MFKLVFFFRMSVSQRCLCCVKYLMFVFNLIFWVGIQQATNVKSSCCTLTSVHCVCTNKVELKFHPLTLMLCFCLHPASCEARRMWLVWRWDLAFLHTGRVLLSSPLLPVPLSCQSAAGRWRHHHGDGLPGMSWSPEGAALPVVHGETSPVFCVLSKLQPPCCGLTVHLLVSVLQFFVILLLLVLTEVTLVLVIHVYHDKVSSPSTRFTISVHYQGSVLVLDPGLPCPFSNFSYFAHFYMDQVWSVSHGLEDTISAEGDK